MNWYRITFECRGKRRTKEVEGHNLSDAIGVALVKLCPVAVRDDAQLVDVACVDTPAWAQQAVQAAANAVRPVDGEGGA
jgi:hypothetical protein